jgi:hypothetical protein
MNLKLKVTARTSNSEEIVIFDADTRDENNKAVNLGKLDVHYVGDQIVGTLLIWQEYATGFNRTHAPGSDETMDTLIDEILAEISEPLGVPVEYGIEVYYPSVQNHYFVSNYSDEDEAEAGEEADEWENVRSAAYEPGEEAEAVPGGEKDGQKGEDDFGKYIRSRP